MWEEYFSFPFAFSSKSDFVTFLIRCFIFYFILVSSADENESIYWFYNLRFMKHLRDSTTFITVQARYIESIFEILFF